jgi:membrane-associated phospholipid phosphatase
LYFPSSPWLAPFAVLNYGLAAAAAAFRVFAGMHFMSDVIAGAILGTVIGSAVIFTRQAGTGATGKAVQAVRLEVPVLSLAF